MYFYNRELVTVTGISPENVGRSENCNSSVMVATISGLRIYFAGDIGNYFRHQCESNAASMIGHEDIEDKFPGYTLYESPFGKDTNTDLKVLFDKEEIGVDDIRKISILWLMDMYIY